MLRKPREIESVNRHGQNFNEDDVFEQEQAHRSKLRENEVESEELEDAMEWVNLDLLCGIIKKIASKAGIDSDKVNILNRGHIFNASGLVDTRDRSLGVYGSISNNIFLKVDEIEKKIRDNNYNRDIFYLYIICHELLHASSKINIKIDDGSSFKTPDNLPIRIQRVKNAFEVKTDVSVKGGAKIKKCLFTIFDEGVNDKLTKEVCLQYINDNSNISEKDKGRYCSYIKQFVAYPEATQFVEELVNAVANKTGVAKKVVWDGFKHAKFSGETFNDPETIRLFNEIIGDNFLKELSELNDASFDSSKLVDIATKYLR